MVTVWWLRRKVLPDGWSIAHMQETKNKCTLKSLKNELLQCRLRILLK
jgi:hypothetical protein